MYIVGIAGGSGSGKTTFSKKVIKHLNEENAVILHMDSYYLHNPPEHIFTNKGTPNFDHPHSFDWELLQQHIMELKNGRPIKTPIYDFKTNSRTEEHVEIGPCKLILFEGIFSLFDNSIREMLDIKCFLHVHFERTQIPGFLRSKIQSSSILGFKTCLASKTKDAIL